LKGHDFVLDSKDGEFMLVISDFQGVILSIFFWMRRYEQSSTMAATTKNLFARWLRIDHSPRKSTKKNNWMRRHLANHMNIHQAWHVYHVYAK